jgi:hypothetical protein
MSFKLITALTDVAAEQRKECQKLLAEMKIRFPQDVEDGHSFDIQPWS